MHDGMPYGQNQGQGQGHSREVDHHSPTGLILIKTFAGRSMKFDLEKFVLNASKFFNTVNL